MNNLIFQMFLLLSLIAFLTYFALQIYWKRMSLPPGPIPFLFLGNYPQLFIGSFRHGGLAATLKALQKQYGDVYTLWLGTNPTVHLCTIETAKEVMVHQGAHQADRPAQYLFTSGSKDEAGKQRGVAWSNGEYWMEHRRFCLTTLRNFGMGRNIMEKRINEEFEFQLSEVESEMEDGKVTVPTHELTDLLVGSVINRLIFGYRFDKERKAKFFEVKHGMDNLLDKALPTDMLLRPYWKSVPFLKKRYDFLTDPVMAIYDFIQENIQKRKSEVASGEHILNDEGDDFIDAYLIEQKKRKQSGQGEGVFDDFGLAADCGDMWVAGQETTSLTLRWAIIFLLNNPEVMRRCNEELDQLTNKGSRLLTLADRSATPYLVSTITESQRVGSILNMNLWRETTAETYCNGYTIPKGTTIAAQLTVLQKDERHFENPLEFNPSRYLGENGKELEQKTIPFGIGKRYCLGEGLARAELYLLLGNLLARYSLSVDPSSPPSGCTTENGIGNRPKLFNLVIEKKQK